ncbi:mechanosensitive ion channel family protein [Trichlorobacter sp.]|uniref:mechanosensitive ion channel family protein n=1 Tax=Trichlorobacter sp. TaxID=2911007 RepID=UPI002A36AEEC|nr:mechanosensitive ion channel family protein [Trichlorobacter sp.]MDY0384520.1 mechanosensitive ion channel family protein [Trichlorobacter sp.]
MGEAATGQLSLSRLLSLADINFLLVNKLMVLVAVLLFFVAVIILRRSKGQVAPDDAWASIKLSLLGMVLLYLETALSAYPHYRGILAGLQGVIVLLCLARLVIYLMVDLVLTIRLKGNVPMLVRDAVRLLVYLLAALFSLHMVFKVDLSAVVATTTVLTAAVAFAMQSTLANLFCGFSIQSDAKLARGTWLALPEKNLFGQLDNVGFRYTTLRTLDNNLVLVPNNQLVQSVVTTHGNRVEEAHQRAAVTLTVGLPYEMPPEEARSLLLAVLAEDSLVLAEPAPQVRLQSLAESSITYLLKFWLTDPQQRNQALDTVQTKVWYAVQRAGWSFPFPRRQVVVDTQLRPSFSSPREAVLEGLRLSHLFEVLSEAELALLADRARMRVFAPGETAVRQGEPGASLYFVLQGTMVVEVDGEPVAELEKGRMFGEMSLLTGAVRSATVRAIGEARLAEVLKEDLACLMQQNDRLLERLSQALERHQAGIRDHQSFKTQSSGPSHLTAADYMRRVRAFFFGGAASC